MISFNNIAMQASLLRPPPQMGQQQPTSNVPLQPGFTPAAPNGTLSPEAQYRLTGAMPTFDGAFAVAQSPVTSLFQGLAQNPVTRNGEAMLTQTGALTETGIRIAKSRVAASLAQTQMTGNVDPQRQQLGNILTALHSNPQLAQQLGALDGQQGISAQELQTLIASQTPTQHPNMLTTPTLAAAGQGAPSTMAQLQAGAQGTDPTLANVIAALTGQGAQPGMTPGFNPQAGQPQGQPNFLTTLLTTLLSSALGGGNSAPAQAASGSPTTATAQQPASSPAAQAPSSNPVGQMFASVIGRALGG
jgi:hypothetical protein